nr:GNAT family N-acetyltransferase [Demequina rhizosphaerae]
MARLCHVDVTCACGGASGARCACRLASEHGRCGSQHPGGDLQGRRRPRGLRGGPRAVGPARARRRRGRARGARRPVRRGVLVAEHDGEPVGYVAVHRLPALFAGGVVAVVEELYVIPDRRAEGIGAALMAEAEHIASGWGAAHICVATSRAVDFYKGLGYEPTARFLKKGLD